jgi:hypothetical protein
MIVRYNKIGIFFVVLFVVIYFPKDHAMEDRDEYEELVPFLVDPVSFWHILLWVC